MVSFALAVAAILPAMAEEPGSGIIIYSTMDHARDEIAIAVPFVKLEQHQLVTNVTTADGQTFRVTKNQLKQIFQPTDLNRSSAVDDAGLGKLRSEASSLRTMQERYPRAKATLEPLATRIEGMVQAIESGNVLVQGRLVPRADYEKQVAASAPKMIDLTVDGKTYANARLTSARDGVVSIMHAGGVASVSIDLLTDEQINQLNATSGGSRIEKPKEVAVAKTAMNSAQERSPSTPSTPGPVEPSSPMSVNGRGTGGLHPASSGEVPGNDHEAPEGAVASMAPVSSIGAMPDVNRVAGLLHGKLVQAARRLENKGRHLEVRSAREIADQIVDGTAEFLAYDDGALVASNVIDNFGDDLGRQRHRELMARLAYATSSEEAAQVKNVMKENAQGYYTGDIEQLHAFAATEEGRGQMNRSMSEPMKRALTHVAFLQETRSRQGVQVSFQREMAGIAVLSEDEMLGFQTLFDLPTRMDIAEALQTGRWDEVDLSIVGEVQAQDSYRQHLMEAHRRSDGMLGSQLEAYNASTAVDPSLTNTFSRMDERDYYQSVVPHEIEQRTQSTLPPANTPLSGPSPDRPAGNPTPNRYDTGDPELERRLIESDKIQSKVFGVPEEEMIQMRKGIIDTISKELSK
jgi:hypothetical protein